MNSLDAIIKNKNLHELLPKDVMILYKHQDLVLLLNLLKLSCECSYELLQAVQSLVTDLDSDLFKEWKVISDKILFKLNLLHQLVGRDQKSIILDMKASLLGNIGALFFNHSFSFLFLTLIFFFKYR